MIGAAAARRTVWLAGLAAFAATCLAACGDDEAQGGGGQGGAGGMGSTVTSSSSGGGQGGDAGGPSTSTGAGAGLPCPEGVICIDEVPFRFEGDTSAEGTTLVDAYACAPDVDEAGPELFFRVRVPSDGLLSAIVSDGAGDDVDVHLLSELDPAAPSGDACFARGDLQAAGDVTSGYAWVVVDTWVNGSGTALSGPFTLDVGFVAATEGPCETTPREVLRIGEAEPIALPSVGPVAVLPHLVTQAEPAPFPTSASDGIDDHRRLGSEATGLVMAWQLGFAAPDGSQGFFGGGVGDPADLPVLDETWHVAMRWTAASRPPAGTRMILRRSDDRTRAVVVAAGYDTAPASTASLAAASEETHFYLGTASDAELELGFAADPQLALGPRRCTD